MKLSAFSWHNSLKCPHGKLSKTKSGCICLSCFQFHWAFLKWVMSLKKKSPRAHEIQHSAKARWWQFTYIHLCMCTCSWVTCLVTGVFSSKSLIVQHHNTRISKRWCTRNSQLIYLNWLRPDGRCFNHAVPACGVQEFKGQGSTKAGFFLEEEL